MTRRDAMQCDAARHSLLERRCLSSISVFPLLLSGFQSRISHRSSTGLGTIFPNGWPSLFLLRANWNLFVRLFKVWSASGSKLSHFQRRLLRKSIDTAGFSSGTPREHRLPGRKFVIPRKKAVLVSGTFSPGVLPFLPGFCGIFTARQTHYGYSGSTMSTLKALQFGNGN
ncbi:hypothetical protein Salat_1096500 [Sesamum alatum]|uniref:Uncharacterized protein n=1 Tax=Sesamum alatum TaxID=300844 RepID=A0AAE1YNM4_9LAMI|nr:hypothetical protein Salat_1096500 [Sesamum alatum]